MANELHETIFQIIDDHSGGIKYMGLLIEVLKRHFTDKSIEEFKNVDDHHIAEYLLEELEKMDGIRVIEYTYKRLNRAKYFVCTE